MNDSAREIFEDQAVQLKGFRDGLRLMVDGSASIEEIESSIRRRMSNLGDSLAGTSIVVDTGNQHLSESDLERISKLIYEAYGLEIIPDPIPPQTEQAKELSSPEYPEKKQATEKETIERPIPIQEQVALSSKPSGVDMQKHDLPGREATCIIRHSLRSGQIERFFEGNIVLFGDVNPGAEVIAGGDVVILGRLRGLAHAGALGNVESVIVAMNLTPTQLRIGHLITRPPKNNFGKRKMQPEIACIENGSISVKAFDGF